MKGTVDGLEIILRPLYFLYKLHEGELKLGGDCGGLKAACHSTVLSHVCLLFTEDHGVVHKEIGHHLSKIEDGNTLHTPGKNNRDETRQTGNVFSKGLTLFLL